MARPFRIVSRALMLTIAAVATGPVFQNGPAMAAASGPFLSHQALYELRLVKSRGSNAISGARGRILYNFSGSACEGYTSSSDTWRNSEARASSRSAICARLPGKTPPAKAIASRSTHG